MSVPEGATLDSCANCEELRVDMSTVKRNAAYPGANSSVALPLRSCL